jgi:hypothetical protein
MSTLMQADRLRDRIMIWAEEEKRAGLLPPKSDVVLRTILFQGILERSLPQARGLPFFLPFQQNTPGDGCQVCSLQNEKVRPRPHREDFTRALCDLKSSGFR